MSHAHVEAYGKQVTVEVDDDGTGDITIRCGDFRICMMREDAAQLAADMLNATGATPVDARQAIA